MEKRVGTALIVVEDKRNVSLLNDLLSRHADIILARQGLPLPDKGMSIISLILYGYSQQINALTGPIGKLEGISVKSLVMPEKKQE